VHHLRKLKDSADPFNEVSGSTGITGAADTNFILKRRRGEETATLLVNGRFVQYQQSHCGLKIRCGRWWNTKTAPSCTEKKYRSSSFVWWIS